MPLVPFVGYFVVLILWVTFAAVLVRGLSVVGSGSVTLPVVLFPDNINHKKTQIICRPLSKFVPILSIFELSFLYLILNIIRFVDSYTCTHCCIENLSDRIARFVYGSHWCIDILSVISSWISSWYLRCMVRFSYSAICSISLLHEVFAVIKKWVLKLYFIELW